MWFLRKIRMEVLIPANIYSKFTVFRPGPLQRIIFPAMQVTGAARAFIVLQVSTSKPFGVDYSNGFAG